jgi:glucan phosphoethanolaminetransferase (alkaline phosphatase superfamily)
VLVIGESVRNDFMHECGGPDRVRTVAAGALVACDVTAGSDSTHTSVPLLVSREMPGHDVRVSSDATFLRALEETGFETYWYGVQGAQLAWSDAQHQDYPAGPPGSDAALLVPRLAAALSRRAARKAIVLHAYNAHEPYCMRYDAANAPYPVQCQALGVEPDRTNIASIRLAYANAVDGSVAFLNAVIGALDAQPQPCFLIFSPDHGENLLDDDRALYGHARRSPTRWDIRVPAVFWANEAWRSTHAAQWAHLESQVGRPLMHADLVPTLLAAADVRYQEPRRLAVNLLAADVPARRRVVQRSLGAVVDWETLESDAWAARRSR